MPHIIVRHSVDENLDIPSLLRRLHEGLASYPSVKAEQTKTYAIPLTHYIVGRGPNLKMIHVEVRMKHGRGPVERKNIAAQLHDIVRAHTETLKPGYGVSVEIHELDNDTYHSSYTQGQ